MGNDVLSSFSDGLEEEILCEMLSILEDDMLLSCDDILGEEAV